MRSASILSLTLLAFATSAAAQQAPPAAPQGIYLSALGGASFGPQANPAAAIAVEFGEHFHPKAQAYITVSYLENIMRNDLRDDLSDLSETLTVVTGREWDIHGQDRGVALTVGGKYIFGAGGDRGPYVGGGAGVLRLKRRITDRQIGDVTEAVLRDFGLGSASLVSQSLNGPVVEGVAGVVMGLGPVRLDVGYRYRRAFQSGESIDLSQLGLGFGVSF